MVGPGPVAELDVALDRPYLLYRRRRYFKDVELKRIIHVAGLQKSGTSLLVRLLENTGMAEFLGGRGKTEGGIDWGNRPSFAPTAFPAGVVYQRNSGAGGHEIGAGDATPDAVEYVRRDAEARLDSLPTQLGISKCPYSTVRLPWIRAILPGMFVVAVVRKPVSNTFSLLKRFRHVDGSRGPEEGWWGVKPRGWREMVSSDKITQIANQWNAVNSKLWQDRRLVDLFVRYDVLCRYPRETLEGLLGGALEERVTLEREFPVLRDFDDEYLRGSGLEPKRRKWIDSNELVLSRDDDPEIGPLSTNEIDTVRQICESTSRTLGLMDC